jgi:transposase
MKKRTEISQNTTPKEQNLSVIVRAQQAQIQTQENQIQTQANLLQTQENQIQTQANLLQTQANLLQTQVNLLQELEKQKAILEEKYKKAEELIQRLNRMNFGAKRERFVQTSPDQLRLELEKNAAEIDKTAEKAAETAAEKIAENLAQPEKETASQKGKKNNKRTVRGLVLSGKLPVEELIIDVEGDKSNLIYVGDEITSELKFAPAKLFVLKIIRKKYLTKPDENLAQTQVMAPLERPMPKCMASPELVANMAVEKFVFHMPLFRQLARLMQNGAYISASTVDSWLVLLANLIAPLYAALREYVLANPYLQADESPIRVLNGEKKGSSHLGYMWVYRAPLQDAVLFDYQNGRGQVCVAENLKNFKGFLQTDGYSVYEKYGGRADVTHVGCWAHVRRKFHEALKNDEKRASTVLLLIQELYAVEREMREKGLNAAEKKAFRLEKSLPLLNQIGKYIAENYREVLPKSAIGVAFSYCLNRWATLLNYLKDGDLEIDNNMIENAIRPLALGRKNYLFAGSQAGAERIAMFYSFFATCKKHDINPEKWLVYVINHIQDTKMSELKNLLPQFFDKNLLI